MPHFTLALAIVSILAAGCRPGSGSSSGIFSNATKNLPLSNGQDDTLPTTGASPTPPSPSGTGSGKVAVSWNANRESGVNSAGGGYRVYYSPSTTVNANTPFVNVPWVSGATTPTTVELSGLSSGTYTISVVAYSAVNPAGSVAAQTSVTLK